MKNVKLLRIPTPNPVLTSLRVISGDEDITSTVRVRHYFDPRQVEIESTIPIVGYIELI